MEYVLEEVVSSEELKKFEKMYNDQMSNGKVSTKTQFEYAWCLVRSKYSSDIKRGIHLLQDLCQSGDEDGKRDYLYYLSIGNAKLKNYSTALKYLDVLLSVEPNNSQVKQLKTVIKKKMEKEGLMGMAIVGGAAIALGAVVGLGIALSKK